MNKLIINFLVFLFLFGVTISISPKASAHVLLTDKNIGLVLHIDPEDDPVVGEPASFFFEFKDKSGQFDPKQCDCQMIISKDGQEIYKTNIYSGVAQPDFDNAAGFYTFLEKGIYQIQVSGQSSNPDQFENFFLSEEIRIDRDRTQVAPSVQKNNFWSDHKLHLIVFGFGMVLVLVIVFYQRKKHV